MYSCSGGLSLLEHDLLLLRQDLQATAQNQMSRGGKLSMQTLGTDLSYLKEPSVLQGVHEKRGNKKIDLKSKNDQIPTK